MSSVETRFSFLVNVGVMNIYPKGENLFLKTLLLPTEAVEYETDGLFRIQQEFDEVQRNVALEFIVPILKLEEAGNIQFFDKKIEYRGIPFVSKKGNTTECFHYLLKNFNVGNTLVANFYRRDIFNSLFPGKFTCPYRKIKKHLKSGRTVQINSYILTGILSDYDVFFSPSSSWSTCTGNGNKADFTLMSPVDFYNCLITGSPFSSFSSQDAD